MLTLTPATLATFAALSAAAPASNPDAPRPSAVAVRAVAAPPQIDGRLDEPAWRHAPVQAGFTQREPAAGQPAAFETEFRVLYDDEAIYVGVRGVDPEPQAVEGRLTRRDEGSASDWILVALDTFHDRRSAFVFAVNPAGVQRDMRITDDTREDVGWNAVWEGATAIDADGWVAELRIPLAELRFSRAEAQTWGLQVGRVVPRTGETSYWAHMPSSEARTVSLFGELRGLEGLSPALRAEVRPFVATGLTVEDVDAADPLHDPVEPQLEVGADFEVGLGPDVTLTGTINPDFGQVEADPSQVNLSDAETFLGERRPFFVEAADLFQLSLGFGDGNSSREGPFYSRRIGSAPHGSPDGRYVDTPQRARILGALKLTGEVDGWAFGALGAVTAETEAEIADEEGSRRREIVEPLTTWSALSLRKDFGARTRVGLLLTATRRELSGTGLADELHGAALTAGLRLDHRFAGEAWGLGVRAFGSFVEGTEQALRATQMASQRYMQRPDARHLGVRDRTHMEGAGASLMAGKLGGAHWRGAVGGEVRSAGLELNDLGYLRKADEGVGWLWGQLRDDAPGGGLTRWVLNTNLWVSSDLAPELKSFGGNVNGSVRTDGQWDVWGGVGLDHTHRHMSLLRGGPAMGGDTQLQGWAGVASDPRETVRFRVQGSASHTPDSGDTGLSASADLEVRPTSDLELSLGTSWQQNWRATQYVATVADDERDDQWLLARLEQTTLGMTLRVSYALAPNLSLQLYAQPFLSAGAFDRYRQPQLDSRFASDHDARFAAADREALGVGAPDFDLRELRSTAVLRWEYLPGSRLYLIWSHSRASEGSDGRFAPGTDLKALFDEPGQHVLMLKLDYRWATG